MQNVVIEEPYKFIPPVKGTFWSSALQYYLRYYLRTTFAVHEIECKNEERIKKSLAAGNRVMIAPNHCRLSDPLVLGVLSKAVGCHVYAMASWHLFKESAYACFMLRRMGAFSIYREGNDRQAISTAIDLLAEGERPLVVFPEGAISRHNDLLMELMDGPAFICRQAAKRLAKKGSDKKVVVHPLAIRYYYEGDVESSILPDITEFEKRFSWQPQTHLSVVDRVKQIGTALLTLKEMEFFGDSFKGDPYERASQFVEKLLSRLEEKWSISKSENSVISRVKAIRTIIIAKVLEGNHSEEYRAELWRDLAGCYYAQQMAHYPRNYLSRQKLLPERLVETIERMEEDFTDAVRYHGPVHCVLSVGEAIEAGTKRERGTTTDPITAAIKSQLTSMLAEMVRERENQLYPNSSLLLKSGSSFA